MAAPEDAARSPAGVARGRRRPGPLRLHHVALEVADLAACERFYTGILGMRVVWRPDDRNLYLSNGSDNLALHQSSGAGGVGRGSLDHIGFALEEPEALEAWHDHLSAHGVSIVAPPRAHRDGTRSLYCRDPEGNTVQLLYEPRLAAKAAGAAGSGAERS